MIFLITFLILNTFQIVYLFGIYLSARLFKIKVDKLYLWYNYRFTLFKVTYNETEFGLGWLPLGGYINLRDFLFNIESEQEEENITLEEGVKSKRKSLFVELFVLMSGALAVLSFGLIFFLIKNNQQSELLDTILDIILFVLSFNLLLLLSSLVYKYVFRKLSFFFKKRIVLFLILFVFSSLMVLIVNIIKKFPINDIILKLIDGNYKTYLQLVYSNDLEVKIILIVSFLIFLEKMFPLFNHGAKVFLHMSEIITGKSEFYNYFNTLNIYSALLTWCFYIFIFLIVFF